MSSEVTGRGACLVRAAGASEKAQRVSLRISLTTRCELSCLYCRGEHGADVLAKDELGFDAVLVLVDALARRHGLAKVGLSGGEPLLRDGIDWLVAELVGRGVPDVRLTTNGQEFASYAGRLSRAGLRRVNFSIDSLDPATYRALTRGGNLARTIAGIENALETGFSPVKLNMVVLRGVNDGDVVGMARFGLERGCPVRFLELMPIGVAAAHHEEWFVCSAEVRDRLAEAFVLHPQQVNPQSSSRDWLACDGSGLAGTVGFISPCSEPFCDGCRRLRLTSAGRLLGCLAREDGIDVRNLLSGPEEQLFGEIERALSLKRSGFSFSVRESMACIGG